jgi:hypothetical protein
MDGSFMADILPEFNKASQEKPIQNTPPSAPEQKGSEQVKNTNHQMHLRPDGSIRNAVDAQDHTEKMAKDNAEAEKQQALQRAEELKKTLDAHNKKQDLKTTFNKVR